MIFRTTIEHFRVYQTKTEVAPFSMRIRPIFRLSLAIVLALALYPIHLIIEAARSLDRILDAVAEGLSTIVYSQSYRNASAQAGQIVGQALQYFQLALIALALAIFAPLLSPIRIMAL